MDEGPAPSPPQRKSCRQELLHPYYSVAHYGEGETWGAGASSSMVALLWAASSPGRCCPQSGQCGSGWVRAAPGRGQGSRPQPPPGPGTGAAPRLGPAGAGSSPLGTCHRDRASVTTSKACVPPTHRTRGPDPSTATRERSGGRGNRRNSPVWRKDRALN
jgi:hypothetical protein